MIQHGWQPAMDLQSSMTANQRWIYNPAWLPTSNGSTILNDCKPAMDLRSNMVANQRWIYNPAWLQTSDGFTIQHDCQQASLLSLHSCNGQLVVQYTHICITSKCACIQSWSVCTTTHITTYYYLYTWCILVPLTFTSRSSNNELVWWHHILDTSHHLHPLLIGQVRILSVGTLYHIAWGQNRRFS